jgi:transposase
MAKQRDHAAMERRRLKAAGYFEGGKSASEVAKLLGVRRQSAHGWLQAWRRTGVKGLASKGPAGPKARLSGKQKAALMKAIIAGPKAHGHATEVWTLPRVARLIEQQSGERYHPGHVWWILRELGLSCQQPTRRAIERNEVAIAEWTERGWPRLKKKRGARSAPSSSSTKAG